ncbi:MAG: secretin N-terminal domain-containing protein, partial [Candidatus Sumerlaeota bacterium]
MNKLRKALVALLLGTVAANGFAADEPKPDAPAAEVKAEPAPAAPAKDGSKAAQGPPPAVRIPSSGAAPNVGEGATGTPAVAAEETSAAPVLVSFGTNGGTIEQAAAQISSIIGAPVNVYGKAAGQKITAFVSDQPVEAALGALANPNGFIWWKDQSKNEYGIADKDYYEKNVLVNQLIQKTYRPNNIKSSELDRAIKGLLTPNLGSSVADDRTNKLIVYDLPVSQERIERFIREIDVQLVVRVFYIRHAEVEDIAKKIESYKSDPGTIEVDTKTHKIVVTDLLSNIKKMELLIDILDVAPEIVIYDVNNIGIDGQDLEDLKTIIDNIRTKEDGLLFEVNEKQGVIILEDVPEVHERVEQVLAGFDQPVKQVMIQGEILSTLFTRNFNLGLNSFSLADKVLSAANQGAFATPLANTIAETGVHFTDMQSIFPNFQLNGGTLTGNYISQTVALQYQAVFNDSSTRVLLQPRLIVKNQEPSKIFVGEEVPFLTTFVDDGATNNTNGTNRTTTTQSTVQSGLTFDVTPSISNSYLIDLDLRIDNDTAKPDDIEDGGVKRHVVGRERQNVETILQIPSGQTRMIGGLIKNLGNEGSSGVPYLAKLPYIGALFGVKTSGKTSSNLLIFITPTVVEDNLPRPTGKDGKRGRLVTDYERVPSDADLQSSDQQSTDYGQKVALTPAELLSSDAQEEKEQLEYIQAAQKKSQ